MLQFATSLRAPLLEKLRVIVSDCLQGATLHVATSLFATLLASRPFAKPIRLRGSVFYHCSRRRLPPWRIVSHPSYLCSMLWIERTDYPRDRLSTKRTHWTDESRATLANYLTRSSAAKESEDCESYDNHKIFHLRMLYQTLWHQYSNDPVENQQQCAFRVILKTPFA